MDYFVINTDAMFNPGPTSSEQKRDHEVWLEHNLAFTGGDYDKYGIGALGRLYPGDVCLMYENTVGLVAVGRVLEKWDGVEHKKPMYYRGLDIYEYRIGVDWFLDLSEMPVGVHELKNLLGRQERGALKRVLKRKAEAESLVRELLARRRTLSPEEIHELDDLTEGAKQTVTVNAYERNAKARRKCLDEFGTTCHVCQMRFDTVYGSLGRGFIHVHHTKPLSEIGEEYVVDPVNDLIPVCPNCHAMLHKKCPPYTIADLREIMKGGD